MVGWLELYGAFNTIYVILRLYSKDYIVNITDLIEINSWSKVRVLHLHLVTDRFKCYNPGPDGQTDRQTCLNGSKPPQVNAKCDVMMKLSVSGTRTGTHTQDKTYTPSRCGL